MSDSLIPFVGQDAADDIVNKMEEMELSEILEVQESLGLILTILADKGHKKARSFSLRLAFFI